MNAPMCYYLQMYVHTCNEAVALASAQGVDTVPTSTLRTSAFLAQHPCHSLETYTKLRYAWM